MTQETRIDPEFLAREYTGVPGMAYRVPGKKDAYAVDVLDGEPVCDDARMFADCTISTSNPDYDGDVIDQLGLDFHFYASNPVVAFKHWEWDLPVGVSQTPGTNDLLIDPNEQRTRAGCYFAQSNPDAVVLYAMVRERMLRASSVSFIPRLVLRHDRETQARVNAVGMPRKKDYPGYRVANAQVDEWSWTPVGANPESVRKAISDGNINGERLTVAMTKSLTPYAAPKPVMVQNPGLAIGPSAVDIVGQAIDRGLGKLITDLETKKAMEAFGADSSGGALVNPVTVGSEEPVPVVENEDKANTISAAKALEKYRAPIASRMATKKGNKMDAPGGAPNADKPITPGLAFVLAVKELVEQFLPIQESPAVITWAKGLYTGGQALQQSDYPDADATWDPAYIMGDEETALDEATEEDGEGSASDVVEDKANEEGSTDEGSEEEESENEDEEPETDKSEEEPGDEKSDMDGDDDSSESDDDEEDEGELPTRKAESGSDSDDEDEEDDEEDEDQQPESKKSLTPEPAPTPAPSPGEVWSKVTDALNEATANIARGMRVISGITGKK